MTKSLDINSIAITMNYLDADFVEGIDMLKKLELSRNVNMIDWERTDITLESAILNPANDGWQGIIFNDGCELSYDGKWKTNIPVR